MKQKRKQRGITLVALVVTVVVLLTLAGITIMYVMGDNGVFNKAKSAKDEMRAGAVQEERDMWKTLEGGNKHLEDNQTETLSELLDRLVKTGRLTEEEKAEVEETGEVTIGTRTIVFGKEEKTLVEAFREGELQIGDYLDYKPVEGKKVSMVPEKTGYSETQTYQVDMATTWRVLGLNKAGTELMIISGSPIKKTGDDFYLHLVGVEGYTYGVENLDRISNIYNDGKYAREARSINMEDITHALGITVDTTNKIAYKTADSTRTPLDGFYGDNIGRIYTYKSGDYAPENYMGTGSKRVGDTIEGVGYELDYTEENIIAQDSKLYGVLFDIGRPNESNLAKNEGERKKLAKSRGTKQMIARTWVLGESPTFRYPRSYWLGDRFISIPNNDHALFFIGSVGWSVGGNYLSQFYNNGRVADVWRGVRPIISLRSDTTVVDIKKIDSCEEEWTGEAGETYETDLTKGKVIE